MKSMREFWQDSYLTSGNESYLEDLYESYLSDPQQVTPYWRNYFNQLTKKYSQGTDVSHQAIHREFMQLAKEPISTKSTVSVDEKRQERVFEMIASFRRLGHLQAKIDPLALNKRMQSPPLDLGFYGFSEKDLNNTFNVGSFSAIQSKMSTLGEIYQELHRIYCGPIGFEFMHINREQEVEWIRDRIENQYANFNPNQEEKLRILDRLIVADGLEKYLGFKYVGQKRFSLEGGDALVPLLDAVINRSAQLGIRECIIGMAHRGRLNVLVNVVGKNPSDIFAGFEGKGISTTHSGDVKYHLGYSSNVQTPSGNVHVALAFNPSHLEIVSPVVQGAVRARQRRRRDSDKQHVLPIQIHGDAAFSSQGVVMETFNMSQARWFTVGGSVHIVINNQIGFTISDPCDARSTIYCTDIAKMIEAPILHVNANDAEAVYFAALFAIDYRQKFKRDVVIDLVCYRRHGHNEADEPSATQPIMYKVIKSMQTPYQLYAKQLVETNNIQAGDEKKIADRYRNALDEGKTVVPVNKDPATYEFVVDWEKFTAHPWDESIETGVKLKKLKHLADQLKQFPEGFVLQPQVKKILEAEKRMTKEEIPVTWGYAETLAYATLLEEGFPIRLCGQDSARGTFAHRHAVLHDQNTDEIYIPLSHLSEHQAQINLVDSLLSEEAVLAFEYGYASAEPNYLVIWEAQFGDFANGAQVVIDQFISSGEQKWGRLCGLVMLLPHGYEGQGPEHSSARLERYLQLCAQDNMQVCVPTTPAQIFHLLRRQMLRPYRKPLIVMSPKSILRHPLATSPLADLANGQFQLMIPEIDAIKENIDRLIFCTGKIYYELLEARRSEQKDHIAIVRIEQLYPFPTAVCKEVLKPYQHVKDVVWCQEEPQNQGAWGTIQSYVSPLLSKDQSLRYIGRAASASPAAGYYAIHEKEQKELVAEALKKRKNS